MEPFILRPGVEPANAASTLRALAASALHASAAGHEWYQVRDAYLQWVETVESQLPHLTSDLSLIAAVQGDHYWRLQDSTARFARPLPMIEGELSRQQDRFESLARELERRRDRIASAPGSIVIVDTNVLLHYQPPEQIPWPEIIGSSPVRLVVPLRVVEELDLKKWGANDRLSARARDLLPRLLKALGPAGAPGGLREDVTIEVPIPSRPRLRPADADEEVLSTCEELTALSGQDAVLVTADTAMTIRAQASGITVKAMADRFKRKQAISTE
jgi:PIN domain